MLPVLRIGPSAQARHARQKRSPLTGHGPYDSRECLAANPRPIGAQRRAVDRAPRLTHPGQFSVKVNSTASPSHSLRDWPAQRRDVRRAPACRRTSLRHAATVPPHQDMGDSLLLQRRDQMGTRHIQDASRLLRREHLPARHQRHGIAPFNMTQQIEQQLRKRRSQGHIDGLLAVIKQP